MKALHPLRLLCMGLLATMAMPALADSVAQSTPSTQAWTNIGQISVSDDWSGVPGITGYLGDISAASTTGVDPRTLLADYVAGPVLSAVDVLANQTNTNLATGGVAEFDSLTDPVVAIQGSGTADAPHLLLYVDMTNRQNLRVRYNLRDLDGSADDAIQQVALHYRVGATGTFTNVATAYVADATTAGAATQVTAVDVTLPVDANATPLVVLRIMTTNAVGNDEWVGVDDIQLTADGTGGLPIFNVSDLQLPEGSSVGNTTAFAFNVNLTAPAPAGGVQFNASTSDGTATVAGSDYNAVNAIGVSIPEGQSSTTVTVNVNQDVSGETNETFNLAISAISNALAGDTQAVGTIQNDDPVEIYQIQGSGNTSPMVGSTVTTNDNSVIALAPNGFFMQTPSARDDLNAATSNGIFVFTSSAPTVTVGDRINVSGTVQEFFDFTQLSGTPTVTVVGSAAPPPALLLDETFPSPLLPLPSCYSDVNVEFANFECIEGMRVAVANGVVNAPNQRFASDPLAEPTILVGANGRGFRESGIQTPGYVGIPASIPLWDANPETFEIDPDKLGLPNRAMNGGTRFSAEGVIGYDFGDFELWPTVLTITQDAPMPRAVPAGSASNLSIGSINMLRFFDTDQANNLSNPAALNCFGTPTCTSLSNCNEVSEEGEYARRMAKFSAYIRNVLRAPDVVAVQEVESIGVLETLVAKIALDDPSLVYTAYLAEGSDVGGIDSGFLVRSGRINPGFTLTQLAKSELFNFDVPASCLHDRPPFRLDGVFSVGNRPFAVIVNHTRSLSGLGDCRPGAAGERLCRKRLAQSESIANLVQSFQTSNPTVPLVIVGDHNAYPFSDGHVDTIGTIRGSAKLAADPNPDSLLAPVADIVEPNLSNAVDSVPAQERYSYFFDRALQVLDHAMLSAAAQAVFVSMNYARGNVDAPLIFERTLSNVAMYGDDLLPSGFESTNEWKGTRVSDHDGFVVRLFP